MKQAPNVIAFPREKVTFKAEKFDLAKVAQRYDADREYLLFSLNLLRMTPAALKKSFAQIETAIAENQDNRLQPNAIGRMIADINGLAEGFRDLAGMLDTTKARLVAVDRKLV